jgi:hypothetical protein
MNHRPETINIIERAFCMIEAVERFVGHARKFFYTVMLSEQTCPQCGGMLAMIGESRCRCENCRHEFDPTVAYQRCSICGGVPILHIRRYHCKACGSEINSRFVFDTLPYDAAYFKQRMQESRQRKQEQLEQVRQMLAQSRSDPVAYEACDLNSVPGLVDALNWLTSGIDEETLIALKNRFDLNKYEEHVVKCIGVDPVNLRDIPPIIDDAKRDLIWRFVAVIFLEHFRQVEIVQENDIIWVKKFANDQGSDVFEGT